MCSSAPVSQKLRLIVGTANVAPAGVICLAVYVIRPLLQSILTAKTTQSNAPSASAITCISEADMKKDKHAKCKAAAIDDKTALYNILEAFENEMLFKMLIERYKSDLVIFEQDIKNEDDAINCSDCILFLEEDFGSKEDLANLKKGKKQTEKALKLIEQAAELLKERHELLGHHWR
jgi:hypothetical protein